ncbi:malonyl-ACP O-methyltransferase BioC [Acinetobacter larvae]|uniref:Malonyl-[acyl-carrier protein] O-methyltransferase n=1 Tax=Acinetobacter larvae TaxID=1789224 RepID=A0A1B2LWW5_9GAMM|nr:malonyl-ACP O-methyltransferase BioC [Acinetobacter larvae]AOA57438.1 malonyl-[acyl-carrier protein] O-methyltransferase BioC [Acinetobacter larvae]
MIDKSQVARRFAKAQQSYADAAVLQQQICQQLMQDIQHYVPQAAYGRVFEIGCGSGNLSQLLVQQHAITQLYLNDLCPEVQAHFPLDPRIQSCIGDIEQIALPHALDLIVSSAALQWVHDLPTLLGKLRSHLKPQGYLCFSSFSVENLIEIKQLTKQGLHYYALNDVVAMLRNAGFELLHATEHIQQLRFNSPKAVLEHLRATGVTATADGFRWTKQSLAQFYTDYQQFAVLDAAGQLHYPLRYHPIYLIARSQA